MARKPAQRRTLSYSLALLALSAVVALSLVLQLRRAADAGLAQAPAPPQPAPLSAGAAAGAAAVAPLPAAGALTASSFGRASQALRRGAGREPPRQPAAALRPLRRAAEAKAAPAPPAPVSAPAAEPALAPTPSSPPSSGRDAPAPLALAPDQPPLEAAQTPPSRPGAGKKAFIFTMDSLAGYVAGSKSGGAAGEMIVREGLSWALQELGFQVDVADSDEAMEEMTAGAAGAAYSLYFFDQWTVMDRASRLRGFLVGREKVLFVLAFFGWSPAAAGLAAIAQANVLTPYPDDRGATFLGFLVDPNRDAEAAWVLRALAAANATEGAGADMRTGAGAATKRRVGVVWGKRREYFEGREAMLSELAASPVLALDELHIVAGKGAARPLSAAAPSVVYHDALSRAEWRALLARSRFLLGLGNPLLGPSALDALAAGCLYIDPSHDGRGTRPLTGDVGTHWVSQHPYLRSNVGAPHVCEVVDVTRFEKGGVRACVERALAQELPPYVVEAFTKPQLLLRVRGILERHDL